MQKWWFDVDLGLKSVIYGVFTNFPLFLRFSLIFMIEFVCTAPTSVRIAIWVAMVTMHFHIAQMGLLRTFFFRIQGVQGNNLASMKDFLGVQDGSN